MKHEGDANPRKNLERIKVLFKRRVKGRPKNQFLGSLDCQRAFLVVVVWSDMPDRFKNRRQVVSYLQSLARIAKTAARYAQQEEDTSLLFNFASKFPIRELEQSVSRGMNEHGGLLLQLEKLAKKGT